MEPALTRSRSRRAGPASGPLVLEGHMAVPQSRENTLTLLVRGLSGGAVGPGLRLVHRDADDVAFVAASMAARVAGAGAGRLTVGTEGGRTVVRYRLSVTEGLVFAGVLGASVALGTAAALSDRSLGAALGTGGAVGGAVAVGWAAFVVRRTRARFDALLHNLRYVS